ncbi:DUF2345 domain-containing protein, partial [Limnobaculum zhutongyuii]
TQNSGMKLLANQGKVEVQAQNDAMQLASKQDMEIASVDGRVIISAKNELLLNCGGGYIRLKDGGIELGCPKNVTVKSIALQKQGAASMNQVIEIPEGCQPAQQGASQGQRASVEL